MSHRRPEQMASQLSMPGMPPPVVERAPATCWSVKPGQQVLYVGKISGGPRYGARGTVKRALLRKAVVDMGRSGTWHIPYWFLGFPAAA